MLLKVLGVHWHERSPNGFFKTTQFLLDRNADIEVGTTNSGLLHKAIVHTKLPIVRLLLEQGAPVDTVDSWKQTPLCTAVEDGKDTFVQVLLDHGATIDKVGDQGATPLIYAVERNHPKIVRLLLDKGAKIDHASELGLQALHVMPDNSNIVRMLLESGADIEAESKDPELTALIIAAFKCRVDAVRTLLEFKPNLDRVGSLGLTALAAAALFGSLEIVELLLEAGADPDQNGRENVTALHVAVGKDFGDIVRALLEYAQDLDAADDDGDTALHLACESGSLGIVKRLVRRGVKLEVPNQKGNTPLCVACREDRLAIVRYLVEREAEVNVSTQSKRGGPLHLARDLEITKLLVEAGGNVEQLDEIAGTPLHAACFRAGHQEGIIRYLVEECKANVNASGGSTGSAFNAACGWSTPAMIKLMLQRQANAQTTDSQGRSPIHLAAFNDLEAFELVVEAGGNIEATDNMGRSTAHCAAIGARSDVIERLSSVSPGLLDKPDFDGWTPLLWAARGSNAYGKDRETEDVTTVVKSLLENKANPLVEGKGIEHTWSPADVAKYHGLDDSVVQVLEEAADEALASEEPKDGSEKAQEEMRSATRPDEYYCYSCFLVSMLIYCS